MIVSNVFDVLYSLLISPIEIIIQLTFYFMYKILGNSGMAIIAVSIVVQTLVLPLYKRADAVQEEERLRQKEMSHWVAHIKKTFKGEERFMMLSYYYRKMDYKPWYAMKSSISLLLQIPFFIAAYHYLSELDLLNGSSFIFIRDLGKPDAFFTMAGFKINVLPIIMTFVNILSCTIYTKGMSIKEKIQPYGLALLFLVLLYNSPSGLVLYWTVNQIYSLIKNLIMKMTGSYKKQNTENSISKVDGKKEDIGIFVVVAAFLAFFAGGVIPLNIIETSAMEFAETGYSPIIILLSNLAVWIGLFVLWGSVFYYLLPAFWNKIILFFLIAISVAGVVNYLFWGNDFGVMSTLLIYEKAPIYGSRDKIINLISLFAIIFVVLMIAVKRIKWIEIFSRIMLISVLVFCAIRFGSVNYQIKEYNKNIQASAGRDEKIIKLSRNGRNVVFIMLDRAISGYIPFIFDEKPDLQEAFTGFTWYPNTVSHGFFTIFGAPGLYGGYEYTPAEMNKRKDVLIPDKHDEALLVLPRLFAENGYEVTVCDPPYAGNDWIPDLSIYDNYPGIKSYITEGTYLDKSAGFSHKFYKKRQKTAFFYHCLMRISPVVVQNFIYKDGKYFSEYTGAIKNEYVKFLRNYTTLISLSDMTEISDGDEDIFLQFQNETTHQPTILRVPDYVPDDELTAETVNLYLQENGGVRTVDGITLKLDTEWRLAHYHVDVASLSALAEWFGYLRSNDCWDNTRIIIAADHGWDLSQFDNMILSNGLDVESINPLLMVKDFEDYEYKISDEFMTNADVPTLAVKGLIEDPINPFTGKLICSDKKHEKQMITSSQNSHFKVNNKYTFDTSDMPWYELTPGNIFDEKNWKQLEIFP